RWLSLPDRPAARDVRRDGFRQEHAGPGVLHHGRQRLAIKKARRSGLFHSCELEYLTAASTARFAITLTRCARYSALACRSLFKPSAFCLIDATDDGSNFAESAFSMSFWRNTHGPAPVTATRVPLALSVTNTPTIAKREAWFLNFV